MGVWVYGCSPLETNSRGQQPVSLEYEQQREAPAGQPSNIAAVPFGLGRAGRGRAHRHRGRELPQRTSSLSGRAPSADGNTAYSTETQTTHTSTSSSVRQAKQPHLHLSFSYCDIEQKCYIS